MSMSSRLGVDWSRFANTSGAATHGAAARAAEAAPTSEIGGKPCKKLSIMLESSLFGSVSGSAPRAL
jgi:hypothetical protein